MIEVSIVYFLFVKFDYCGCCFFLDSDIVLVGEVVDLLEFGSEFVKVIFLEFVGFYVEEVSVE